MSSRRYPDWSLRRNRKTRTNNGKTEIQADGETRNRNGPSAQAGSINNCNRGQATGKSFGEGPIESHQQFRDFAHRPANR